jgi:CDP-diacylglycerol pyrophosphatase
MKTTNKYLMAMLIAAAGITACNNNDTTEAETTPNGDQDDALARVYINECDPNPNVKQWELYNPEAYAVNLAGWTMYKGQHTTLPYYLIYFQPFMP